MWHLEPTVEKAESLPIDYMEGYLAGDELIVFAQWVQSSKTSKRHSAHTNAGIQSPHVSHTLAMTSMQKHPHWVRQHRGGVKVKSPHYWHHKAQNVIINSLYMRRILSTCWWIASIQTCPDDGWNVFDSILNAAFVQFHSMWHWKP